jgi:hypothetical protein
MDKSYELIEQVLETLKKTHRRINAEIDLLVNSGVDEDDVQDLKRSVDNLYAHNLHVQDLLFHVLSDQWDAKATREAIIKQRIFLAMKSSEDESPKSMMHWLAIKLEANQHSDKTEGE